MDGEQCGGAGADVGRRHGHDLALARLLAHRAHGGADLVAVGQEPTPRHGVAVRRNRVNLLHHLGAQADAAAPLVTGVDDGVAGAADAGAIRIGELVGHVIEVLGRACHRRGALVVAAPGTVPHDPPDALEIGLRPALPGIPGGGLQGVRLAQLGRDVGGGDLPPLAITGQGLILERRPLTHVGVGELEPLVGVAVLERDAGEGVATPAHRHQVLVLERLDDVGRALEDVARDRAFLRRQALGIRQVLHQGAALVGRQLDAVPDVHAHQRHVPALGRLAHVGDAAELAVRPRLVTGGATRIEDALWVARLGRGTPGAGRQNRDEARRAQRPREVSHMFHERILPLGPPWDRSPRAPSEQGFRAFFFPPSTSLEGKSDLPSGRDRDHAAGPELGQKPIAAIGPYARQKHGIGRALEGPRRAPASRDQAPGCRRPVTARTQGLAPAAEPPCGAATGAPRGRRRAAAPSAQQPAVA